MSVYQWRLKDAKLNSRGLLSPWKPRIRLQKTVWKTGIGNVYNGSSPKNMFFYITAQRDGHAELVSASHCEPLLTPLPSVRSWNKFRMTLGGSCYFYIHFRAPQFNTYVLLSNLNDSLLKYSFVFSQNPITHCQTFLLLSLITHRFYYEQKSAKYSSKTNLIHLKKQPYWKKINFQLRKNNFPVGKQNFSNWAFPAFQLDFSGNSVL